MHRKVVVTGLAVMVLLHDGGRHQAAVVVQYGLGEAGGPRGEVESSVIRLGDLHSRRLARTVRRHLAVALGERRAIGAHEEARVELGHPVYHRLDPAYELGSEDQRSRLGEFEAVLDLVGGVAVVHGHRHRAGLEDAEVDGQPLKAVHEQDGHLVAPADAPAEEQIGEAIGSLVELPPGDLPAGEIVRVGLHELVLAPGDLALLFHFGVDADEADLVAVERGVA